MTMPPGSQIRSFNFNDVDLSDGPGRMEGCQLHARDVHVDADPNAAPIEGVYTYVASIGQLACARHPGSNCPVTSTLRNAGNITVGFQAQGKHLNEIVSAARDAFSDVVWCAPDPSAEL